MKCFAIVDESGRGQVFADIVMSTDVVFVESVAGDLMRAVPVHAPSMSALHSAPFTE